MRIAILGAGSAGSCTALELAARGYDVDLYDENELPVSRASYHNEGKIHLGLIYAKDPSLRTARWMILGALHFAQHLKRWIDFTPECINISTPFYYAAHRDTMLGVESLRTHYARCQALFSEMQQSTGLKYLIDHDVYECEEVTLGEMEQWLEPEYFLALFRTWELGVDPRTVAAQIRAAVLDSPRIRFISQARVESVGPADLDALSVGFRKEGAYFRESYDQVANTLWHGRMEIDAQMGLPPLHHWLHRYKLANRVLIPLEPEDVPSITCVLGPFGDIVNFGKGGLFLSWYPEGMIESSSEVRPPEWEALLSPAERMQVFERSVREWQKRCPVLHQLRFRKEDVDPGGGIIFAWGATDLDDPHSRLHNRYEIGIHSLRNYHSVNTGKYTLAPYMAFKTADRILGLS